MAVDDFGNKVEQKYTVKINPNLGVKVSGVDDGGLYNKDVTPVVEYNENDYIRDYDKFLDFSR